jgi:exosome complex component CSL4
VVTVVHGTGRGVAFPSVGDLVTLRVTRITPNAANGDILAVNGRPVVGDPPFRAVVRQENVVATEIDKVVMEHCFRPGDLVAAVVASLGDARSFFLSTAAPELGVIAARAEPPLLPVGGAGCEEGEELVPASLAEMVSPASGVRYPRKVARPPVPPPAVDAPTGAGGGEGAAGV